MLVLPGLLVVYVQMSYLKMILWLELFFFYSPIGKQEERAAAPCRPYRLITWGTRRTRRSNVLYAASRLVSDDRSLDCWDSTILPINCLTQTAKPHIEFAEESRSMIEKRMYTQSGFQIERGVRVYDVREDTSFFTPVWTECIATVSKTLINAQNPETCHRFVTPHQRENGLHSRKPFSIQNAVIGFYERWKK